MDHSARRGSPQPGSKTGGRLGEPTGIRYTKGRRGGTHVPGFRAQSSTCPSSPHSRPVPSKPKLVHNGAQAVGRYPGRAFAVSPRASVLAIAVSYRDSAHGEEGRATGKRNTERPGFRTPNHRGFMHGATGILNTRPSPFTGRPYTENARSPRIDERTLRVTLSSNQIQNQSTLLLLFIEGTHD